jgi:cell division protein FtsQ
MWRKGMTGMGYLLLIAFFAVTLSFSSRESKNISCRSIQVEFRDDESIKISEEEIVRLVRAADSDILGKELRQINAEKVEKEIEKHQAILKAEVYKVIARDTATYKGILGIRVRHREPVMRVMSPDGSFFLDHFGEKVPVSDRYAARVLVATGYFTEDFARKELLPFVLFIREDPFWEAQLEQIYVEQNGNVLLTPLFGDHVIELGTLEDYPDKLRNMKAFYEQVVVKNNWNKYEQISVKFKNQIIAKKR